MQVCWLRFQHKCLFGRTHINRGIWGKGTKNSLQQPVRWLLAYVSLPFCMLLHLNNIINILFFLYISIAIYIYLGCCCRWKSHSRQSTKTYSKQRAFWSSDENIRDLGVYLSIWCKECGVIWENFCTPASVIVCSLRLGVTETDQTSELPRVSDFKNACISHVILIWKVPF